MHSNLLCLCAVAFQVSAQGLGEQRDATQSDHSFPVQTQTRAGVTVRVKDAGWYRQGELPNRYATGEHKKDVVFAVSIEATSRKPIEIRKGVVFRGDLRHQLNCSLVSPLYRRHCGFSVPDHPELAVSEGVTRLDPRSSLLLEIDFRDPRMSQDAAEGVVEDYVDIAGLPALHVEGETRAINVSRSTRQGARIVLTNVGIKRFPYGDHELRYFVTGYKVLPADKPDLTLQFEPALPASVRSEVKNVADDDLGNPLATEHMPDFQLAGDILQPSNHMQGRFTFMVRPPAAQARFVNLHLTTRMRSQAFRDETAIQHFRFVLPARELRLVPGEPGGSKQQIAVKPLGDTGGTVTIEKLEPGSDVAFSAAWNGRLLLRSEVPQAETRRWTATRFEWRLPGESWPGGLGFLEDGNPVGGRLLTRRDGSLLASTDSEWDYRLGFDGSKTRKPPEKMTFYSEWAEVESHPFALDFQNVPIPRPGTVISMRRVSEVGSFGRFVVRKVGWYDAEQTLSTGVAAIGKMQNPHAGLAVVIDYEAAPGTPDPLWDRLPSSNPWAFREWDAEDTRGRDLARSETRDSQHAIQDELEPKSSRSAMTVFLLPPAPGVKSFRLQARAVRAVTLRRATVTFEDLAAPKATGR